MSFKIYWWNRGLQDNNTEMCSIHIEWKSVFAERFNRALKNKIEKYLISILKNVNIDKLYDIVNEYSNAYNHKNIIRTEIACNKISCYMRGSACSWIIVENAKVF